MRNLVSDRMRWIAASALCMICVQGLAAGGEARLTYPEARRSDQVDDYFGEKVADPYRWMEDLDSAETKAWVDAENKLTFSYLDQIPQRPAIKKRLTELWDYERFGIPVKRGARYFYTRNDGLQNQAVLYVADSLNAAPRVLFDPNKLLADGTVALTGWSPSDDGKRLVYSLAEAGSDWEEWKVRDVETGTDFKDEVKWVKFVSATWTKDGSGFYYGGFDAPKAGAPSKGANYFNKLFFHKLGDPQSSDKLIYQRPDAKEWMFDPEVTEDGRYLVINIWRGSDGTNQIFYRDLKMPNAPVVELITGFDAKYEFIGNNGGRFWFMTDFAAPLGRLIAIDIANPDRAKWKNVIPESPQALQQVGLVGDRFFALYLKDAVSRVKTFDLAGSPGRDIQLPGTGSVAGFDGRRSDSETFFAYSDFVHPGSIYRYDLSSGEDKLFREPKVRFDQSAFETQEVFVKSKDGTRVPMFLTYRRGMKRDGGNPTILYGYGAFKISITPRFSPETMVFLERGGVYAQASLRGGFEYGQAWHEAGMRGNKQNVFDDFISSAEWLIANKYTRSEKLAIRGASNGGLLVGATITQRPELFAAALPAVGVLDMLRFQKFTIGWAWAAEWGSSDNAEDFRHLRAYSPLHNIKPGTQYPATLVTTGDHDDRVLPAHSFKFAAALQNAQAGTAPVLIRIETRTGHGQGRPTTKQIEQAADSLAFIAKSLKMGD
jgi:prolyl oligopeptidase